MENNNNEAKFYFVSVECYAPMSGTIPVEAESPEAAEKKVIDELSGSAKEIKILNIEEAPPPPTQIVEEPAPTLN